MTSLNEARTAIYNRFLTEWGNTTPFTFQNEQFDAPEAGAWVRVTVRSLPGGQESLGRIGNRRYNRQGAIFVQVFTDTNSGVSQADTLATQAQNIFEGLSFDGVYTNNSQIRDGGVDGRWLYTIVEIEFFFEEIK